MVSTAKYSSHECGAIKDGRLSLDSRSVKKTCRHSSSLHTLSNSLLLQWLFNLPLVVQLINICLMSAVSILGQEFQTIQVHFVLTQNKKVHAD